MDRYRNLRLAFKELAGIGHRHVNYVEIGTYDGKRAEELLRLWLSGKLAPKGRPAVRFTAEYIGFDLFEHMTPEKSQAELSKSKLPPSEGAVRARLLMTGARVRLYKGDTTKTIPRAVQTELDLLSDPRIIFLDGGHSLETIDSDWAALEPTITPDTIVLLDDYYSNREDFGCKQLVRRLKLESATWDVSLLDPIDHVEHTDLDIRMVRVRKKSWSVG